MLFRAIAVAILAGSVLVAVVAFDEPGAPSTAPPATGATTVDLLAVELRRCQALGPAAQDDAGCRDAWRKNRERFFRSGSLRSDRAVDPRAVSLPAYGWRPLWE